MGAKVRSAMIVGDHVGLKSKLMILLEERPWSSVAVADLARRESLLGATIHKAPSPSLVQQGVSLRE